MVLHMVVFQMVVVQRMGDVPLVEDNIPLVVDQNEYNDELLILLDDVVVDMGGMKIAPSIQVQIVVVPCMIVYTYSSYA